MGMINLYHKEVYWNRRFDDMSFGLVLSANKLSKHLQSHIDNQHNKHQIDIAKLYLIVKDLKENGIKDKVYEVECEDFVVTKAVIRTEYDDNRDISIVFRHGIIVSAWINNKEDTHRTLNRDLYATAY